jgi:hypothetical protein
MPFREVQGVTHVLASDALGPSLIRSPLPGDVGDARLPPPTSCPKQDHGIVDGDARWRRNVEWSERVALGTAP